MGPVMRAAFPHRLPAAAENQNDYRHEEQYDRDEQTMHEQFEQLLGDFDNENIS